MTPSPRRGRRFVLVAGLAALAAPAPASRPQAQDPDRTLRVLLTAARQPVRVEAAAGWRFEDDQGRLLSVARPGETWRVQWVGHTARAVRSDGAQTPAAVRVLVAAPVAADDFLRLDGKRWRGAVRFVPQDTALLVVNVVEVEDYLRGVVPLEIGRRTDDEAAAIQAQAVAARSYAYGRKRGAARHAAFDLYGDVRDQAYGGRDAERDDADLAVIATDGLVLMAGGRVASAPYFSTCGGRTAAPGELFRGAAEPHLTSVDDRIPGTERHWCDISPRFEWRRVIEGDRLAAGVERYLRQYVAGVPAGSLGAVRMVQVTARTATDRAASVQVATERGAWELRGNDIRFVLREVGAEPLPSTYLTLAPEVAGGRLARVVVRGRGNGHGVGMCQWGAIGRARAGQDLRTILRAYYPGAEVRPATY
jgi:stage II sporulation protein D